MYDKERIPPEVKRAFSATYTNQYDPWYVESEYIIPRKLLRIMFDELDMCAYSKTDGHPIQLKADAFNNVLEWMGFQYWHKGYEAWHPNTAFPMILFKHPTPQRRYVDGVREMRISLNYNKNIIVPFMAKFQEQTNMFGRPSEYVKVPKKRGRPRKNP